MCDHCLSWKKEAGGGLVERVRVVERTATDAGPGENEAVAQQVDALDAEETESGRPQELLEIPAGLREVRVGVATARLEDADLVALLDQSERGDTATESGTDDEDVVLRCALLAHHSTSNDT